VQMTTPRYIVYINDPNQKSVGHVETYPHAKIWGGETTAAGGWLGPFGSREEAEHAGQQSGNPFNWCGHCSKALRSRTSEVTIMRAFLVLCLVMALFQSAAAADKIKIEIVESRTKTQTVDVTIPGSPEQADASCTTDAMRDSVHCKSTVTPATSPHPGQRLLLQFFANAILPDGSHALLICLVGVDKDCAGIAPMAPEKSTLKCETAENVVTCTDKNLGVYEAKRDKNDLVIYGPKGKLKYHIAGSW